MVRQPNFPTRRLSVLARGELHEFGPFHRGKGPVDPCPLCAISRQDRTLRPRLACSRRGLAPVALGELWRDGEAERRVGFDLAADLYEEGIEIGRAHV